MKIVKWIVIAVVLLLVIGVVVLYANLNRIVVLKGKSGRLAYINEFVEQAKASGLVQKAIDHAGPRGLTVAPPGDF